jgi:hypothetical protein
MGEASQVSPAPPPKRHAPGTQEEAKSSKLRGSQAGQHEHKRCLVVIWDACTELDRLGEGYVVST